jgi:serine/threonine-protein kinase
MRREPFELKPRQAIDRYELLVPVAATGASEVWAACRRGPFESATIVALRADGLSHSDSGNDGDEVPLELELVPHIEHPNIVECLDLVQHEGVSCSIFEWVEGRSLSDLLSGVPLGSPLPLGIAVRIVMQACQGVQAVHERCGSEGRMLGFAHGHLCPDNFVITTSGNVKLVEHGIGRAHPNHGRPRGQVEGSFFAPELAWGEHVDLRADVFSLGMMLCLLTTGVLPAPGLPGWEPLSAIAREWSTTIPKGALDRCPRGLQKVLLRALSTRREVRFQSAGEMLEALVAAFPDHASETELAALLHRVCGDSIRREALRIEQAIERDGAIEPAVPFIPDSTSERLPDTLSPVALVGVRFEKEGAAHVSLAMVAMAFIVAFGVTLVVYSGKWWAPSAMAVTHAPPLANLRAASQAAPSLSTRLRRDSAVEPGAATFGSSEAPLKPRAPAARPAADPASSSRRVRPSPSARPSEPAPDTVARRYGI